MGHVKCIKHQGTEDPTKALPRDTARPRGAQAGGDCATLGGRWATALVRPSSSPKGISPAPAQSKGEPQRRSPALDPRTPGGTATGTRARDGTWPPCRAAGTVTPGPQRHPFRPVDADPPHVHPPEDSGPSHQANSGARGDTPRSGRRARRVEHLPGGFSAGPDLGL